MHMSGSSTHSHPEKMFLEGSRVSFQSGNWNPWRSSCFLFLHGGHRSIYIYFYLPICLKSPVDNGIFFPVVQEVAVEPVSWLSM